MGGLSDPQGPQAPRRGHPQPLGRTLLGRPCACWPVASRSTVATPASSSRPSRQATAPTVETKATSALADAAVVRRSPGRRRQGHQASSQRARAGPARQRRRHRARRRPRPRLAVGRRSRRPARRLAGRLPGDGQGRARRRPTGPGPLLRDCRRHAAPHLEPPSRSSSSSPTPIDSPIVEDVPAALPETPPRPRPLRPQPGARRGRVGHGAHHLADLRLEGGRCSPYGPDDRPRLDRRVVLGPQRHRLRPRPRGRRVRAGRPQAAPTTAAPPAPDCPLVEPARPRLLDSEAACR